MTALIVVALALTLAATATPAPAPGPVAPAATQESRAVEPGGPAARAAAQRLVNGLAEEAAALERQTLRAGPPGPRPAILTTDEATAIAQSSERLSEWLADHPIDRTTAVRDAADAEWTISFIRSPKVADEEVEAVVLVSDETGEITEVRTGPQVAWMMARGYPGAFGRAINRPSIWLTLSALFLLPLLDLRRLVGWRTLDLLVLLSFGVSLIWFNRGEIFTSVPLAYPPLIYLALRLTWIGWRRARAGPGGDAPSGAGVELPSWPPRWVLATCLAVALALRYGLNALDSNVIDVGYAGVIGADRIAHGITPYGTFPSDCSRCDTYGPLTYLSYLPFETLMPWTGSWDGLPAAHGAATMFDLLAIGGLLALGWSLRGSRLALGLALAWAAFPFTGYALATNSNDGLVAAALIWGLVAARSPFGRGLAIGLAVSAKLGPAVLILLWSRHPFPRARPHRGLVRFAGGLGTAAGLVGWVLLLDGLDGVRAFWSRTLGYQLGRESPFSAWGQFEALRPVQLALTGLVLVAAVALVRYPRRLDLPGWAAFSGALMIGLELTLSHWFYLYIPWFLPFALVAMVPRWPAPEPIARAVRSPAPIARAAEPALTPG